MRVAAVQHDIHWEDREATLRHLAPQVAAAAATGARLVVLTEMFPTGFSMRTHRTAEEEDGPSTRWLREQAERHDVWLAGSVAQQVEGDERAANTCLLVGPDGSVHRYRKIHPFTYAGEHERFVAGDRFVTVDLEGVRVTLFVCYDLRFADEFWATAADTDCYLVVANWPAARRRHWQVLLEARAIENQAYVVGVNRVGSGGDLEYAGDSRIIDPMGQVLAAGSVGETILIGEVDPQEVARTRERFPFLQDRR